MPKSIIEAYDDPEHELREGAQSITPKTLVETMKVLRKIAGAVEREIWANHFREWLSFQKGDFDGT